MNALAFVVVALLIGAPVFAQDFDPNCPPGFCFHRTERARPVVRQVVRYREPSWRSMSQDKAREWIKDQAKAFCRKYPKDEACQKSEPER